MFYVVYKITNLVNNKIYVGVHKTKNLNDEYMGSGVNIKSAIKKYGTENFMREYLAVFDNPEQMYRMESEIVNNEFISCDETYNISLGGLGSWEHINKNLTNEQKKEKGKCLGENYGSLAGSWKDYQKRIRVWKVVPIEIRQENARKMGLEFGGYNQLNDNEIKERLDKIKDIDLMKMGWVKKVSDVLEISHAQVKRFIKKYYKGEYYQRKSPE